MNTKIYLLTLAIMAAFNTGFSQPINLTRITNGVPANERGGFPSFAWGDFNKDGYLDLFVSCYDGTNRLYLNNRDGTFTKVTQGAPVADIDYHTGIAADDYDNDGNPDLFTSAGWLPTPILRTNSLYHGNGDGTFTALGGGSLANQLGGFDTCAWVDIDNDGFLDLYLRARGTNDGFHQVRVPATNQLWHADGNGNFALVTSGPIPNDFGLWRGASWADYDNDGLMDLVVYNNGINSPNFLYHNLGYGAFVRVLTNAIATDLLTTGASSGAWGDYDNDGLLDLFVIDWDGHNRLYHNNGHGAFTKVTSVASYPMLVPPTGAYGNAAVWGDYDNDGYLDLFVSSYLGPNGLYHNNGDGTFTEIRDAGPVIDVGPATNCVACSWADYDNDGFLDLLVMEAGSGYVLQYHNSTNSNAWLEVKLGGTVSNRSAIGAKVRLRATIGGKTFWQLREIHNGDIWSVEPLVAHFGLGQATNAEVLRIEWPSGTVQEFQNVAPRQILIITEPPRLLASATNGVPQFLLKGGRFMQYDVLASTDLLSWPPIATVTITNLNGTVPIVDTNAPGLSRRFYRAVSH